MSAGMTRYRIEFIADEIDEVRLREVLKREMQARRLMIVREKVDENDSPLWGRIFDLMADEGIWRPKSLIGSLGQGATAFAVNRALKSLASCGVIVKVQHGVYMLRGAKVPGPGTIEPMRRNRPRVTETRMLDLLAEPRTALSIRDGLGVSRQRVALVLKTLIAAGRVKRAGVSRDTGKPMFVAVIPS